MLWRSTTTFGAAYFWCGTKFSEGRISTLAWGKIFLSGGGPGDRG